MRQLEDISARLSETRTAGVSSSPDWTSMTIWCPPLIPGLLSSPSPAKEEECVTKTRMERDEDECRGESDGNEWSGEKSGTQERERGEISLARRTWACGHVSGDTPHWMDALTGHVVSADVLGACTFVTFWDDLTPPGFVLLLADVLVKQAIWEGERRSQILTHQHHMRKVLR